MSVDDTLSKIDKLLASDHWPAPCCGEWHLLGQKNPWPITCCGVRYEVNTQRGSHAG